jgi:tetratricopeptide (TPR) repeat protein
MNTKFYPFILLFLLPFLVVSQDFKKQYDEAFDKSDNTKQEKILKDWQAKNPNDPELYISMFNFHVNKGRSEMLGLSTDQQSKEALAIQDSTNNAVGFLGAVVTYDPDEIKKALAAIDKGIALHPRRLDMRFGKMYLLSDANRFPEVATELIKAIEYGQQKHDWLWKDGKPLEEPKEFFLDNVQAYVGNIYDTGDDKLLPQMRDISEAVLKYFPNHVECLSNVAITYLLTGQYDKALPYLLKAEKINSKDTVVLNNIAEVYKRSGKITEAKAYYEKIISVGGENDKAYAQKKLKELN